jgi:hypothetical protein
LSGVLMAEIPGEVCASANSGNASMLNAAMKVAVRSQVLDVGMEYLPGLPELPDAKRWSPAPGALWHAASER